MSLLLRDTENYGNVYIEDAAIAEIGCVAYDADTVIDAKRKALVPGFVNTHTHAAMTLFRDLASGGETDRGRCLLGHKTCVP
jgi:5-methylthioadenosine/S-adenosylhomocysteine deaminase